MNLQRNSPDNPNFVCRIDHTLNKDWGTVVADLCRTFYGIQFAKYAELTGYDDVNFKLSKCIFQYGDFCDSLVLKFVNFWEAKFYPKLCEAQTELAKLLSIGGINCPQSVKTIDGLLYIDYHCSNPQMATVEMGGPNKCGGTVSPQMPTPVVLRTFVPGTSLGDWVKSSARTTKIFVNCVDLFCEQIGSMLGAFHAICDRQKFNPPIFHQYAPIMAVEHWHFHRHEFELQKQTGKMGENIAKLCAKVFDEFEQNVLMKRGEFVHGLVHGDFNESNLLVTGEWTDETTVSALIDFGDVHFSFRILDLANAIVYLYMLWTDVMPSAGPADLNGLAKCLSHAYCASFGHPLPPNAVSHLTLFARARLVLSLVIGLRTQRLVGQNGGMEYVLKQQKIAQKMLEQLQSNAIVLTD